MPSIADKENILKFSYVDDGLDLGQKMDGFVDYEPVGKHLLMDRGDTILKFKDFYTECRATEYLQQIVEGLPDELVIQQ